MRTAGWIFVVLGILMVIATSAKGHSTFAAWFWTGLGVFLLYRANNKKEEEEKKNIND